MIAPKAPQSLVHIAARVDTRLRTLLDFEHARWTEIDEDLGPPLARSVDLCSPEANDFVQHFAHWVL